MICIEAFVHFQQVRSIHARHGYVQPVHHERNRRDHDVDDYTDSCLGLHRVNHVVIAIPNEIPIINQNNCGRFISLVSVS